MANDNNLKQQLCYTLSTHDPSQWDFTNPAAEQFAGKEGVLILLWSAQQQQAPTEQLQAILKSQYALHLRYRNAYRQVMQALHQVNIPVIHMRGLSLVPFYRENIAYRPQSDIDLLFQPEDFLRAKQALGDIGFVPDESYPNVFKRGTIQLDLHTEPLGIERIKSWAHLTPLRAHDFFDHTQPDDLLGEKSLVVSPLIVLPYLCFHALKHSFERLIWLYDIALIAQSIDKDNSWSQLLDYITQYQLERPCFYALSYVDKHLNSPVPSSLLSAIQPQMGFIEKRIFKRFMQHENIPFLAERLFSRMLPSFKHRLKFWHETIYPSYEVRKQMSNGGCVKCTFIRTRIKQISKAIWSFTKEIFLVVRA
jgi:hypothetical protein